MEELPTRAEEMEHAGEDGAEFQTLVNSVEIRGNGNGWVKALRCVRMSMGEPEASERRKPAEVPGSEFTIPVEALIVVIVTSQTLC